MDMLKILAVFLLAAAPISEVRGAIPYGVWVGLNPLTVFFVAVVGNIAPVLPLLLLLGSLEAMLSRFVESGKGPRLFLKTAKLYFNYAKRARDRVRPFVNKYGALGLAIFTAIPFPLTGAWTSVLAAHVLGMDRKVALLSISLGVTTAGVVVSVLIGIVTLSI
ncbi:MAG: hypothetical protein DRJ98_04905 [Thermoprotei archaeon]|nr:MAG: hypothetical protein DRJ98_04905 [Thermoprotei archaeon]RLF17929.1 MAG: hypothetical protein DRN06_02775 [Thermoprotei archaeon]